MEEKVLSKNSIAEKPSIPLEKISVSSELFIPREVEDKIRYLCNKFPSTEWSGVLFYSYEGDWKSNLKLICKDILVMDIGSTGYTEFDINPDVISYAIENNLLDYQMALIHSHHSMSTFFSGTDVNTLALEGERRNHFLSLIVNNDGQYSARITRKVQMSRKIKESYSFGTFNDENIKGEAQYEENAEKIQYAELNITIENGNRFQEIEQRLLSISNQKKIVKTDTKHPTLFDSNSFMDRSFDYDKNKDFLPKDYYSKDYIPKEYLDACIKQIITGSITLSATSKIDVNRWAKTMDKTFGKRFANLKDYSYFMEFFIEYVITNADGINKDNFVDETDLYAEIAQLLIKEFKKLDDNAYIKEIITILEGWTGY